MATEFAEPLEVEYAAPAPVADIVALPRRTPGLGVWSGLWPKVAAAGLVVAAWQLVAWSGWRPDYVLPGPVPVIERLLQDLRQRRRRGRAVFDRQRPAQCRPSLAGDLPSRFLSRRADPHQCAQRHRAGTLGHQRQIPRCACLRTARRTDARPGPRLCPRRQQPGDAQTKESARFHRVQDRRQERHAVGGGGVAEVC